MQPTVPTIVLLTAVSSAVAGLNLSKSDRAIIPTGYRLYLHPYPGDGVFKGRVRIDIACNTANYQGSLTEIMLNVAPSLNVIDRDVKVTRLADLDSSEEDDDESSEDTVLSVSSVERQGDTYIVHLSQKLQHDSMYQLDLSFEGQLAVDPTKTFYQNHYVDLATNEKRWFVVLNVKPGTAREVFPCFDEPQLKTWIELSVAHKGDFQVLTSMPVIDVTNVTADGAIVRDNFGRTPFMSVNSLALLISDFQQTHVNYMDNDEIRIGVWGRKDFVSALTKAQQLLPSVLVSLEIFLSRPYPLPQLNMVALPNYTSDNYINSWGLQLFKESDLMNGNTYWLSHRLAKAAATQWLIHLTTPSNETAVTQALASFLASVVAKQNGVALGLDQVDQPAYDSHVRNYHSLYLELSKPRSYTKEEQKTAMAITKAQLFFQMLEHTLGTSTFKLGIQNFLSDREFKMYTDDDIWASLTDQARLDETLKEPLTVKDIANSWLNQERIPLVTVLRNYKENSISFTQEPFVNHLETRLGLSKIVKKPSAPDEFWWIPLVLVGQKNASNPSAWSTTSPVAWLQPHQHELSLANISQKDQYIVLNPGNIGLFLVNYDTDNWKMLGDHISEMPESVRIQLLHDSLSLALAGKLDMVTALNLTLFLKTEQSPVVWKTFYPLADRIRKQFLGTKASKNFDLYLQALILPPLEAVGEEADKTSTWRSDFRVKTRHLLCSTNFPNCIEHARGYYAIWLNTSQPDAGMPIANIHLCPVFAYGSDDEWNFGLERLINFSPNRSMSERSFLLKTLAGCSKTEEKYEKLLNLTFLDEAANETFSEADRYTILSAMSEQPEGYRALYYYLRNNFESLKLKLHGNLWEFFIQMAMSQFKCQEGLNKVTELYKQREGQFGNGEKKAQESIESVRARVKWAEEKIPAVETWLNATMANPWKPQRFRFEDTMGITRTRKFG